METRYGKTHVCWRDQRVPVKCEKEQSDGWSVVDEVGAEIVVAEKPFKRHCGIPTLVNLTYMEMK